LGEGAEPERKSEDRLGRAARPPDNTGASAPNALRAVPDDRD
jgi:hypothetical protein